MQWLGSLALTSSYGSLIIGSCRVVGGLRCGRGKILSENSGITLPSMTHCQGKIYFQVHIPSQRQNHKQKGSGHL